MHVEEFLKMAEMTNDQNHITPFQVRVEKLEKLRVAGIDPWPPCKKVTATAQEILDTFETQTQPHKYAIAGRVMTIREHGKSIFTHMQDRTGKIQIYLKKEVVGEERFSQFLHLFDIGDVVWFSGTPFKTRIGEITLSVADFMLLSKCLFPLPDKFHGLADVEMRQRQ